MKKKSKQTRNRKIKRELKAKAKKKYGNRDITLRESLLDHTEFMIDIIKHRITEYCDNECPGKPYEQVDIKADKLISLLDDMKTNMLAKMREQKCATNPIHYSAKK